MGAVSKLDRGARLEVSPMMETTQPPVLSENTESTESTEMTQAPALLAVPTIDCALPENTENTENTENAEGAENTVGMAESEAESEVETEEQPPALGGSTERGLGRPLRAKLYAMLRELKALECAWPFLDPVPIDQVPGYAEAIALPMDLPTIQRKLDSDAYSSVEDVARDLDLISTNCLRFNSGVEDAGDFIECATAFRRHVGRQVCTPSPPSLSFSFAFSFSLCVCVTCSWQSSGVRSWSR